MFNDSGFFFFFLFSVAASDLSSPLRFRCGNSQNRPVHVVGHLLYNHSSRNLMESKKSKKKRTRGSVDIRGADGIKRLELNKFVQVEN